MAASAHKCWRSDDDHWDLRDTPYCPQCRKRALECGRTEGELAKVADDRDRVHACLRRGPGPKTRAERFTELLVRRLVESRFPTVDPDAVRRELASWNLTSLDPEQEQFFAEMRALFEDALEELDREDRAKKRFVVENTRTAEWYRSERLTSAGPVREDLFISSKEGAQATADALNAEGTGNWIVKERPAKSRHGDQVSETSQSATPEDGS